jgi:putative ABC transport system substrate-binding protein
MFMKKVMAIAGLCLAALLFMSAGGRDNSGSGGPGQVKIGLAKIVQHDALDACERGIVDALAERGIDAVIDRQNANGDPNAAAQIANKFKSDRVDVAVGIATPIAVALATAMQDIPVVFS